MASTPLVLAIGLVGVGWATGGGAAQILFSVFGEQVWNRGAAGIGEIWGSAGAGLIVGGLAANRWGKRIGFTGYKRTVTVCYLIHGASYVAFSLLKIYPLALAAIALSRASVAFCVVLNYTQLLRHVADEFRGRVFSTMETMVWGAMMVSMTVAGYLSTTTDPRLIGAVAGVLSSTTALWWGWLNLAGKLPEPAIEGIDPDDVEVHGEPNA
jgi:hypothetical protein